MEYTAKSVCECWGPRRRGNYEKAIQVTKLESRSQEEADEQGAEAAVKEEGAEQGAEAAAKEVGGEQEEVDAEDSGAERSGADWEDEKK